jgi:hypothetical protein
MKNEIKLQRLFAAARTAGEAPAGEMPGYLKTRILADWRLGSDIDDTWATLVMVFRRGLVCASVAMVAALAWTFVASSDLSLDEEALANYELRAQVMP